MQFEIGGWNVRNKLQTLNIDREREGGLAGNWNQALQR